MKLFILFFSVLSFTLVFIQLFVSAQFATKGEEILFLQKRKDDLIVENLKLKEEIAEINNIANLESKAESLGYVKIDENNVKYIVLD